MTNSLFSQVKSVFVLKIVVVVALFTAIMGCSSIPSNNYEYVGIEDMEVPVTGSLTGQAAIKDISGQDRNVLKMIPGSWFTTKVIVPDNGAKFAMEWLGDVRPDTRLNLTARAQSGLLVTKDISPRDARDWQRTVLDLKPLKGQNVEITLSMTGGELPSQVLVRRIETFTETGPVVFSESYAWMMFFLIGIGTVFMAFNGVSLFSVNKAVRKFKSSPNMPVDLPDFSEIRSAFKDLALRMESIESHVSSQRESSNDIISKMKSVLGNQDVNVGLQAQTLDRTEGLLNLFEEKISNKSPINGTGLN